MSHIEETVVFLCVLALSSCSITFMYFGVLQSFVKTHTFELSTYLSNMAEHHQ